MPIKYSTPGVYIDELSSNIHTIAGVPTSRTAFIGRAKYGPVNEPVLVTSFGEFQTQFGGMWSESKLGYSVNDFFNNGGSEAFIVRLFKEPVAEDSPPSKTQIKIADLNFEAANPGLWGESLILEIDFNIYQEYANQYKLDKEKMFNLTVQEILIEKNKRKIINIESYTNLTLEDHQNRVNRVLENQSTLLRYKTVDELPSDLSSVKALANKGVVICSVKESIDSIKNKIDELSDDKKDEEKTLEKQLNALKSSDGEYLDADSFVGSGNEENKEGLYALEKIEPNIFNLLCIPPYNEDDVDPDVINKAAAYCEKKRAFMIVDPPSSWKSKDDAINGLSKIGTKSANAALYFPRVIGPDPLNNFQPKEFAPSGTIAGIIASTDNAVGIWKAPAGVNAVLQGVSGLSVKITDDDNGELNPIGINCLRHFPVYGNIVWGARTLQGADMLQSEWKYINVRRLSLYIEQTLEEGTRWAVFEPNDEALWAQLRMQIGSFMSGLFAQGAFQGSSPSDAFFVKVDATTTTQSDVEEGIVNILVGFAPVKPAEFIILTIQQKAGQI